MSGTTEEGDTPLNLVWLEITGRCQLECVHCYAASGPKASPGTMTEHDWCRVIDQAAVLGVGTVQLIGGEPTLHPGLPALVERALAGGMTVEVYSNLVGIAPRLWEVLERPGVRLAISPEGEVWPCVFSRWLRLGNVRASSLADIYSYLLGLDRGPVRAPASARGRPYRTHPGGKQVPARLRPTMPAQLHLSARLRSHSGQPARPEGR